MIPINVTQAIVMQRNFLVSAFAAAGTVTGRRKPSLCHGNPERTRSFLSRYAAFPTDLARSGQPTDREEADSSSLGKPLSLVGSEARQTSTGAAIAGTKFTVHFHFSHLCRLA
jgi:hypothetical protein